MGLAKKTRILHSMGGKETSLSLLSIFKCKILNFRDCGHDWPQGKRVRYYI